MNASFRFASLAVGLALASGCIGTGPAEPDGDRQANNGDETVHSRTFVRIDADGTKTSDVRFVTKRAQIDSRERGKLDGIAHAPSTGATDPVPSAGKGTMDDRFHPPSGDVTKREVESVIDACPGLEIFDAEDATGNSVCFTIANRDVATAIDLADLQRYVDCGAGFCYSGSWAGAVRSLRAGPDAVTLSGAKVEKPVTYASQTSVLAADPRLPLTSTVTFLPTSALSK
jgi:hypothetical protein